MRTSVVGFVIALSLSVVSPALAQSTHAAPQSALDAALQRHVSSAAADRQDVQRVLEHPQVKAVAQQAGLDLRDASSAVATLDPQELSRIASQARQVEQALAGGQSRITISTTAIIIGLLVLILIIVAVN
jgi:hypothetical protein